jgi:hypothetical protein
MDVKSFLQQQG